MKAEVECILFFFLFYSLVICRSSTNIHREEENANQRLHCSVRSRTAMLVSVWTAVYHPRMVCGGLVVRQMTGRLYIVENH